MQTRTSGSSTTQWNIRCTRPGRLYVCFSPWPITSELPSESLERNHAISSCKGERNSTCNRSSTLGTPSADCSYNTMHAHDRTHASTIYVISKSLAACIGRPFASAVCYLLLLLLLLKKLCYCHVHVLAGETLKSIALYMCAKHRHHSIRYVKIVQSLRYTWRAQ